MREVFEADWALTPESKQAAASGADKDKDKEKEKEKATSGA
jgi:hypothetical protein